MTKVQIYTDGSARGNPDGPGGYGAVLQFMDSKGQLHEKVLSAGYEPLETRKKRHSQKCRSVGAPFGSQSPSSGFVYMGEGTCRTPAERALRQAGNGCSRRRSSDD